VEFINKNTILIVITAFFSTLLAVWSIYVDPIINMDATLYLSAAEEFSDGEIHNALRLYKWPFYSALIAAIHSISGISILNSAYLLNILLQAIAAIGFLACVNALGGNKRTLIIAALIILLFPSISKYRAFIIRDTGFIACYLWAIFYLLRGLNNQQISSFIFSGIAMLLAVFFRIEAIAPLVIIPLYLLYLQSKTNISRYLWLLLTIISSLVLFCGLSIWLFGEVSMLRGSSVSGFFTESMQQALESLTFRVEIIREKVLNILSQKYAPMVLVITVLLIIIYEPIRRLAFLYAYLAWYAIRHKLVLNTQLIRKIFFALCAIQLALMAIFATINMFLVSRHTLALVLTILLLTPFSLEHLLNQWQIRNNKIIKWSIPALAFLLLVIGIEGLDVRTNKKDIIEAGRWVSETVDYNYSLYSNNGLLMHYADRKPAYYNLQFNWKEADFLIATNKIFDFDYAVIEVKQNDAGAESYLSQKLLSSPIAKRNLHSDKLLLVYDMRKVSPSQSLNSEYLKIR